jgi:GNAT superfamily N-acetyltransferase
LDIYKNVGGNFGWTGRLILEQYLLANLLKSNKSNVYFLYSENKIAGFYELDFSDIENVEITYFGLLPEFYGKGFGTFLINSAKKTAFEKGANRIFLHTCEFDSDGALNFYIKSGFSVYQETVDYEYYTQDFINRNVNLSK